MAKKPKEIVHSPPEEIISGDHLNPLPDHVPNLAARTVELGRDPAEGFPSAELLAEIRAKTRDFSVFEAQYPSIANAGRHIGPALGLGPINTAEAILLWQHWIGHE